jgi:uncharacterized protein
VYFTGAGAADGDLGFTWAILSIGRLQGALQGRPVAQLEGVIMIRVIPAMVIYAAAASSLYAQTPVPAVEGPVVVTSGEAIVNRTPDQAWVQITAESRARSPREAQKLNADAMSAVLQKLKGAGIAGDAVQTRGYDLQPEYEYGNGRQTLRGYVARNSVEVRVDELARAGEIVDMAVTAGATSVGGIRFDLKDRAAAEREALRLAVEDARRRADAAAGGAGMKVERIIRIEEHRATVAPPRPVMMAMRAGAAQAAGEPPIEAGELEVRGAVTLTAAIR